MNNTWYVPGNQRGKSTDMNTRQLISTIWAKRSRGWLLLELFALVIASHSSLISQAQGQQTVETRAFVSIAPQAYFVERIGGERITVDVLVPPAQSPETFEPTPRQMAALSEAEIFFCIGLPFEERLLQKTSMTNARLQIVDTRKGITLRSMDEEINDNHEHGRHGRFDPHIWLDPRLVEIQARNIADALIQVDTAGTTIFEKNLAEFQHDLREIDSTIAGILAPLKGHKIYVYHPAYGYFADAYGLRQVAVETGGKEPGARQLADLISRAQKDSVRVIFVQPQFSQKSAKTLAEAIDGAVLPLDPLARDYLANLGRMARIIERALAGPSVNAGD